MSPLILKSIALLTMTLDHLGLVFGSQGWDFLPVPSPLLRTVGRISFPLYAFCLAQGWQQTKNRKKYFLHILLAAIASQIPFTLAFNRRNLTDFSSGIPTFVHLSGSYLLLAAVAALVYWYFVLDRQYKPSIILVYLAGLIPGIQWQFHWVCLLDFHTNVLYTFLLSFYLLYLPLRWRRSTTIERFFLISAAFLFLVAYGLEADYGTYALGIVLILGFAFIEKKELQALYGMLWSLMYYGLMAGNVNYALACAFAGILIVFYTPQKQNRYRGKKLFYIYYPLHLFVLGLTNVAIRIGQ